MPLPIDNFREGPGCHQGRTTCVQAVLVPGSIVRIIPDVARMMMGGRGYKDEIENGEYEKNDRKSLMGK